MTPDRHGPPTTTPDHVSAEATLEALARGQDKARPGAAGSLREAPPTLTINRLGYRCEQHSRVGQTLDRSFGNAARLRAGGVNDGMSARKTLTSRPTTTTG